MRLRRCAARDPRSYTLAAGRVQTSQTCRSARRIGRIRNPPRCIRRTVTVTFGRSCLRRAMTTSHSVRPEQRASGRTSGGTRSSSSESASGSVLATGALIDPASRANPSTTLRQRRTLPFLLSFRSSLFSQRSGPRAAPHLCSFSRNFLESPSFDPIGGVCRTGERRRPSSGAFDGRRPPSCPSVSVSGSPGGGAGPCDTGGASVGTISCAPDAAGRLDEFARRLRRSWC